MRKGSTAVFGLALLLSAGIIGALSYLNLAMSNLQKRIYPTEFAPIVSKLCGLWGVKMICGDTQIIYSHRIKRSLGRAYPSKKIVRLNPQLQTRSKHLLEEVICHELAHIAAYHRYGGIIRPHGREWQGMMRIAGYEPRVRIAVDLGLPPARISKCYTHRCPVCHTVRIAKKPMVHWRCAECVANDLKGLLEIEGEQ